MKKHIFTLIFAFLSLTAFSQQQDKTAPKFDVTRPNAKTTAQMNSMTRMVEGSEVWNIDTQTEWRFVSGSWANQWTGGGTGSGTTYTFNSPLSESGGVVELNMSAFDWTGILGAYPNLAVEGSDYLLLDGSRSMTGDLNMGTKNITSVGRITASENVNIGGNSALGGSLGLQPNTSIATVNGRNEIAALTGNIIGFKQVSGSPELRFSFNSLLTNGTLDFSDTDVTWNGNSLLGGTGSTSGDNLGNHNASQQLSMNSNNIRDAHLVSSRGVYGTRGGTFGMLGPNSFGIIPNDLDVPSGEFAVEYDFDNMYWKINNSPIITAANAAANGIGTGGGTDDQTAAEVPYDNTNTPNLSPNVQLAIEELAASGGLAPNKSFFADFYVTREGNTFTVTPNESLVGYTTFTGTDHTALLTQAKAELLTNRPENPAMYVQLGAGQFQFHNFEWGGVRNTFNGDERLYINGLGSSTVIIVSQADADGIILSARSKVTIENVEYFVSAGAGSLVDSNAQGSNSSGSVSTGSKHSTFKNIVGQSNSDEPVFRLVNPFYNSFETSVIASQHGTAIQFHNESTTTFFGNSNIKDCVIFYGSGADDRGVLTSTDNDRGINDLTLDHVKILAFAGESGENNGGVISSGRPVEFNKTSNVHITGGDFEYGNGILANDVRHLVVDGNTYILPISAPNEVAVGLTVDGDSKGVYFHGLIDGKGRAFVNGVVTNTPAEGYTIPFIVEDAAGWNSRIEMRGFLNGVALRDSIKVGVNRRIDINMDIEGEGEPFVRIDERISSAHTNKLEKAFRKEGGIYNWIVSGDSRYAAGYTFYGDYIANQLGKINISVDMNAQSGQSTGGWLSNSNNATLNELLSLIPSDGENSFVQFGWGFNDTQRTLDEYVTLFSDAILAIKSEKPRVSIIMVTPIYTNSTGKGDLMRSAYQIVSEKYDLKWIDPYQIMSDVYTEPNFYYDSVHEDRFGAMREINYILEQAATGNVLKHITLENIEPYRIGLPSENLSSVEVGSWTANTNGANSNTNHRRFSQINVVENSVLQVDHLGNSTSIIFLGENNTHLKTDFLAIKSDSGFREVVVPEGALIARMNISSDGVAYDALNDNPSLVYKQNPVTLTQKEINVGMLITQPIIESSNTFSLQALNESAIAALESSSPEQFSKFNGYKVVGTDSQVFEDVFVDNNAAAKSNTNSIGDFESAGISTHLSVDNIEIRIGGVNSLKIENNGTDLKEANVTLAIPEGVYTVSYWSLKTAWTQAFLSLSGQGVSGGFFSISNSDSATNDEWVYREGVVTITANANAVNLKIGMNAFAAGHLAYYDDIKITAQTASTVTVNKVQSAYVDGVEYPLDISSDNSNNNPISNSQAANIIYKTETTYTVTAADLLNANGIIAYKGAADFTATLPEIGASGDKIRFSLYDYTDATMTINTFDGKSYQLFDDDNDVGFMLIDDGVVKYWKPSGNWVEVGTNLLTDSNAATNDSNSTTGFTESFSPNANITFSSVPSTGTDEYMIEAEMQSDGVAAYILITATGLTVGDSYTVAIKDQAIGNSPRITAWQGVTTSPNITPTANITDHVVSIVPNNSTIEMRFYPSADANGLTGDLYRLLELNLTKD